MTLVRVICNPAKGFLFREISSFGVGIRHVTGTHVWPGTTAMPLQYKKSSVLHLHSHYQYHGCDASNIWPRFEASASSFKSLVELGATNTVAILAAVTPRSAWPLRYQPLSVSLSTGPTLLKDSALSS